jgi:ribosomal protein S18 acetylase RimI-like enzyme
MPMQIRTFEESDTAAVTSLWEQSLPNRTGHNSPAAAIRRKLEFQRELFFVGEDACRIVGTVVAGYDGARGWLYSVVVDPAVRRRGLGTLLLRHAEQALRDLGCAKINLQVMPDNAAVVGFYRTLGYDVEERISMGKRLEAR